MVTVKKFMVTSVTVTLSRLVKLGAHDPSSDSAGWSRVNWPTPDVLPRQ